MKQYLKLFTDSVSKALDTIGATNLNDIAEDIRRSASEVNKKFNQLSKEINRMLAITKIDIPYDRDKETLSFTIDGNKITVKVQSCEDDTVVSERTVTRVLPSTVDMNSIFQKYDKENKKMVFHFKNSFKAPVEEAETEAVPNDIIENPTENVVLEEEDEEVVVTDTASSTQTVGEAVEEICERMEEALSDDKADKVATAKSLREQGWSYRRIGKELGVSDKTVSRWLR